MPPNRLLIGSVAPAFVAQSSQGERVTLAQWRGRKIWLAFFRHVACPLCTLRIREMRDRFEPALGQRLQILAVFQSPRQNFTRRGADIQKHAWFPLLSDPTEALYALYHLDADWRGFFSKEAVAGFVKAASEGLLPGGWDGSVGRIPADFLIDGDGIIRDVFYGKNVNDHIPFERVDRFLAQ